ncbi:methyltransferase domain-containing protein [Azospirillum sp.]|uniref:methyltransferase domain-containing protein n=1 Tax=Azospirillum sp. TaxID=34012 RepID=UPI002D542A36|nr:methyltransferase domain-containing protein [Azospirillum sp.]HYD70495.1 methyltransferase domain-containing protein [Azospirillum sp.]
MDILPRKTRCSVCGGGNLETVFELPNFPITGIFVERPVSGPVQGYDQALLSCPDCGHAQLQRTVPPARLYGEGYSHRSTICHLMPAATRFFIDYVDRLTGGRVFDCILEIGCNDLMLLKRMAPRGRTVVGIDPIWKGRDHEAPTPIHMIGKFIEEVDFARDLPARPQLIFSTHNLEHIDEPAEQFARLMEAAADDALFVIEVPDIDIMTRNLRFDQVFHQHVHYFGLASFIAFIERIGGHYVDHAFDYRNWGGSLIVAFRKGQGERPAIQAPQPTPAHLAEHYGMFRRRMADVMRQATRFDGPLWGYGAGQMVPAVAYHLDSDLSFLEGVFDDNPQRAGLVWPHLAPVIRTPAEDTRLDDAGAMILALDGVRPIMNRLRALNPRQIFVPINAF